jgi:trehalose 6-phosphate synthase
VKADLVVASNRGPLSIKSSEDADEDVVDRGGGGLVSGMQSALTAAPDSVWVCAAMSERERALSREAGGRLSKIDMVAEALRGDFDVRMLPIDAQTYRQSYNGIANATLWFVLHRLYAPATTPVFDGAWRRQWASYERYNRAFAEALADEAADGAKVMIQDYHLFLTPRMLRELRPDLRISHFTHTPWVPAEYFRILPDDVAHDVLTGMAEADLLGFHTRRWADQFLQCYSEIVGGTPRARPEVFPLATDADELTERAAQRDVVAARRRLQRQFGDRKVIGRVDRTELSKNVYRGLLAYRELLRTRPEWRGRVVHAIFDYPSREDLPEYREYIARVEDLADQIDDEFTDDDWSPLLLNIGHDYPGSLAALQMSDVLLVNSVRDGMNLVVLEGVTLSERDAAVVLSRDAGAADVLGEDALLVNPFDVVQTADALHEALSMPAEERAARAERLRTAAVGLPPGAWFQAQLDAVG